MDTTYKTDDQYYMVEAKQHQGKQQRYIASDTELINAAYQLDDWSYEEVTKSKVIEWYGYFDEAPAELLAKLEESEIVIELRNYTGETQYLLPQDAPSKIEWALNELGHDLSYFRAEPITANEALNFKLKSI